MSFLQPWLLLGLPLLLLPIIIHLINQWRYQTKKWGAMMFLLAANRMARGYAKIRQYLILAARMLAIAALVFAVSRPLSSGLMGLAGGKADVTLVLLDRSPSMQVRSEGGAETKLETARRQLRQSLQTVGSNRWVLIDGATQKPKEYDSVQDLFDAPETTASTTSADLPAMLQAAVEYLQNNKPGQTEIWISSDLRESDWNSDSSQWSAIRDTFSKLPQMPRFHLLAFSEGAQENLSIRVTDVVREDTENGQELLVSLLIARDEATSGSKNVPIQLEVNGTRLEVTAELTGSSVEIKNHRIPLDASQRRGYGKVAIPADANLADNEFYFVYDEPPPRKTVLIGEDQDAMRPLEIAAGIAPDAKTDAVVERYSIEQANQIDWTDAGLILWQGRLPAESLHEKLMLFVKRGGTLLFFPPTPDDSGQFINASSNQQTFAGLQWSEWKAAEKAMVENWRGDQDLLAATRSGASLPVGQLELKGHAAIRGEHTSLASLSGGDPLLAKATIEEGSVYFFTASTSPKFSNLARGGIVLFVAIQRALDQGLESLSNTRDLVAGEVQDQKEPWRRIAGPQDVLSTEYAFQGGVYEGNDQWISVNRALQEDQGTLVEEDQLTEMFRGLDLHRVQSKAGSTASIVREIWRAFLIMMILAMIGEAALCLPKVYRPQGGVA